MVLLFSPPSMLLPLGLLLLSISQAVDCRSVPVYHLNAEFDFRSLQQTTTDTSYYIFSHRTERDWFSNKHDCLHTVEKLPFPSQVILNLNTEIMVLLFVTNFDIFQWPLFLFSHLPSSSLKLLSRIFFIPFCALLGS